MSDELHATLWLDEDGNPLHVMRFGERFSPVEMQAIRKALQAAETVIAHTDDPARQQTKIEYLSWALAELSDAVQAWVLEGEPPRSPMSNPVPVPVELMDDYTPIAAELDEMMPEKRIARQKEDFKVKFAAMLRKLIDEREREATRIEAIARRQRIQARSQR